MNLGGKKGFQREMKELKDIFEFQSFILHVEMCATSYLHKCKNVC